MYIKCDNVEQLDEVRKYIKPSPINSIRDLFTSKWMFEFYDNKEPIYVDEESVDWKPRKYIKENNIPYIAFSQWKENIIKNTPMLQIRITNADKTNWYKNGELYIVTEDGDYYKYEDKYIDKNHCEVLYPIAKEVARLYNKGLNTSTIAEKLNVDVEYVDSLINGAYKGFAEYIFNMVKVYETPDQFIQLEGGKLNITKCKELGLFIEDKKVFRYEYEENRGKDWHRKIYKIFDGDELIVELINPTPDKLRSELHYYGIEVDVE